MKRLGRYELLTVLGEGGQGTVYDAVLLGPGGFRKPVALKVLKGGGDGLVREARLGGVLRHQNLVEVYALEQIDGTWVCAMERMPGGTLRLHEPLPPRAVVDVGLQVCAGLSHAHARIGLVHGDLKPSNLLLSRATVKIGDFGTARARGFRGSRRIQGTPAYMSPEQARGEQIDARSDLYSLGVCLYELATGMRPAVHTAPGMTWSTIDVDALEQPSTPELRTGDLPWLAPVLARCLAPNREDRFEDADALAEALATLEPAGRGLADALGLSVAPEATRSTGPSRSSTRTVGAGTTNLGSEVDAFVGRQIDLEALDRAVEEGRPVTLKGVGGAGKTRLARQFADRWVRRTRGEAWFVDLAAARSASDLVRSVAEVLEIPLGAGDPAALAVQLGRALGGRGPVLLVLDNFEQITEHAGLVAPWVGGTVRLLFTSREPVRVPAEIVHDVEPLELDEAVELLTLRAADRGRDVSGDPAVPELARRLDGLPLALELAAGRLGVLTPAKVLARLDDRLKLLGGGVRGGRQATLRATLDTSWDALNEHERSALAQLSVFRGGFALEMADRVIELPEDAPWELDVVSSLVDRSLVVRQTAGSRFSLLESVRMYAAEKLDDPAAAEVRHGQAFAAFAQELMNWQSKQLNAFVRLARELDNLVVACERAIARRDTAVAVDTLKVASELLDIKGPHSLTLDLARRVDELPLDRHQRAIHGMLLGRTLKRCGRSRESYERAESARAVFRELGDKRHEADTLNHLGNLLRSLGRSDEAMAFLDEAEKLYEEVGDQRSMAMTWGNKGGVLYLLGRYEEAASLFEAALHVRRALGDKRGEAHVLTSLAVVEQIMGQRGAARRRYEEALHSSRDVGDRRQEAQALANLGVLAVDSDDRARAEALWLQALEIRRSMGEVNGEGILLGYLALLAVEQGDYDLAEQRGFAARKLHEETGNRRLLGATMGHLGAVAVCRGDLALARERLVEARDLSASVGDRIGLATSLHWWARMLRAEGKPAEALEALEAAAEAIGDRHLPTATMVEAWRAWALDAVGRNAEARAVIDAAADKLRTSAMTRGLGLVLTLKAWVYRDPAILEQAEPHLPHADGATAALFSEIRELLG